MIERQTDLSLEQLREIIKKNGSVKRCTGIVMPCDSWQSLPDDLIPMGLVMNEIGTIFLLEDQSAEEDLLHMLKGSEMAMTTAYFYLIFGEDRLSPEGISTLAAFENDPANQDLVKYMRQQVANARQEESPSAA